MSVDKQSPGGFKPVKPEDLPNLLRKFDPALAAQQNRSLEEKERTRRASEAERSRQVAAANFDRERAQREQELNSRIIRLYPRNQEIRLEDIVQVEDNGGGQTIGLRLGSKRDIILKLTRDKTNSPELARLFEGVKKRPQRYDIQWDVRTDKEYTEIISVEVSRVERTEISHVKVEDINKDGTATHKVEKVVQRGNLGKLFRLKPKTRKMKVQVADEDFRVGKPNESILFNRVEEATLGQHEMMFMFKEVKTALFDRAGDTSERKEYSYHRYAHVTNFSGGGDLAGPGYDCGDAA